MQPQLTQWQPLVEWDLVTWFMCPRHRLNRIRNKLSHLAAEIVSAMLVIMQEGCHIQPPHLPVEAMAPGQDITRSEMFSVLFNESLRDMTLAFVMRKALSVSQQSRFVWKNISDSGSFLIPEFFSRVEKHHEDCFSSQWTPACKFFLLFFCGHLSSSTEQNPFSNSHLWMLAGQEHVKTMVCGSGVFLERSHVITEHFGRDTSRFWWRCEVLWFLMIPRHFCLAQFTFSFNISKCAGDIT